MKMLSGTHTIKDLERLSGVLAHTIRMWEKRYGLLEPVRSDTNIRMYSDQDLKKIMKVAYLNRQGYKISHLASMDAGGLNRLYDSVRRRESPYSEQTDILMMVMMEFDEAGFESLYKSVSGKHGTTAFFEGIGFPFLRDLGLLWETDSITPAHEHFMSSLIRRKIESEINRIKSPQGSYRDGGVLLFQFPGDLHELGLLWAQYLIRSKGIPYTYLGASVPVEDVALMLSSGKPVAFYIHSVVGSPESIARDLNLLLGISSHTRGAIGGPSGTATAEIYTHHRLDYIHEPDEFRNWLQEISIGTEQI